MTRVVGVVMATTVEAMRMRNHRTLLLVFDQQSPFGLFFLQLFSIFLSSGICGSTNRVRAFSGVNTKPS